MTRAKTFTSTVLLAFPLAVITDAFKRIAFSGSYTSAHTVLFYDISVVVGKVASFAKESRNSAVTHSSPAFFIRVVRVTGSVDCSVIPREVVWHEFVMGVVASEMDTFIVLMIVEADPVTAVIKWVQVDLVFMGPSMLQVHAGRKKVNILVASWVDASRLQTRFRIRPAVLVTSEHFRAAFTGPAVPREQVIFALNFDLIETINRPVFSVSIIIVNEFVV
jgi:hypothetical protein